MSEYSQQGIGMQYYVSDKAYFYTCPFSNTSIRSIPESCSFSNEKDAVDHCTSDLKCLHIVCNTENCIATSSKITSKPSPNITTRAYEKILLKVSNKNLWISTPSEWTCDESTDFDLCGIDTLAASLKCRGNDQCIGFVCYSEKCFLTPYGFRTLGPNEQISLPTYKKQSQGQTTSGSSSLNSKITIAYIFVMVVFSIVILSLLIYIYRLKNSNEPQQWTLNAQALEPRPPKKNHWFAYTGNQSRTTAMGTSESITSQMQDNVPVEPLSHASKSIMSTEAHVMKNPMLWSAEDVSTWLITKNTAPTEVITRIYSQNITGETLIRFIPEKPDSEAQKILKLLFSGVSGSYGIREFVADVRKLINGAALGIQGQYSSSIASSHNASHASFQDIE